MAQESSFSNHIPREPCFFDLYEITICDDEGWHFYLDERSNLNVLPILQVFWGQQICPRSLPGTVTVDVDRSTIAKSMSAKSLTCPGDRPTIICRYDDMATYHLRDNAWPYDGSIYCFVCCLSAARTGAHVEKAARACNFCKALEAPE